MTITYRVSRFENLANIWTEHTTVYETNNYVEPIAAEDDGKYL